MITDFRGKRVTKERKADDHTLETLRELMGNKGKRRIIAESAILGVHPPTKYSR